MRYVETNLARKSSSINGELDWLLSEGLDVGNITLEDIERVNLIKFALLVITWAEFRRS